MKCRRGQGAPRTAVRAASRPASVSSSLPKRPEIFLAYDYHRQHAAQEERGFGRLNQ